jgi:hypothetical protein
MHPAVITPKPKDLELKKRQGMSKDITPVQFCSQSKLLSIQSIIVLALLILSSIPAAANDHKPGTVYDIQCGCLAESKNAAELVLRLNKLDLPWYSLRMDLCTRFIVDVNVDRKGYSTFMKTYPEFSDAFLVENHWDLPHPDPEEISPPPTRDEFITYMAPYMRKQYQNGYYNRRKLPMAEKRALMYTRFIYDAASYYDLDPFLLFAVGNFETYFYNVLGDLDRMKRRHPDPAQGMFQILKSTARSIYQDMKKRNIPYAPEMLPADLRAYPKTQTYFAAHHLHNLQKEQYGNRYLALISYNGTSATNYEYPQKVMRFYERALRYFIQSSKRPPDPPEDRNRK